MLRGEDKDLLLVHQAIITGILEQTQPSISEVCSPAPHASKLLRLRRQHFAENVKGSCVSCSGRSGSGGRE